MEVIQQLEKASAQARSEVRDIKARMKVKREDLKKSQSNLSLYEGFDYSKIYKLEEANERKDETEDFLLKVENLAEKRAKVSALIEVLSEAEGIVTPKLDQSDWNT